MPGHPPPCCGVPAVDVNQSPPLFLIQQPTPERENVVGQIINEEIILTSYLRLKFVKS